MGGTSCKKKPKYYQIICEGFYHLKPGREKSQLQDLDVALQTEKKDFKKKMGEREEERKSKAGLFYFCADQNFSDNITLLLSRLNVTA